jgi:hypothetical protein
LLHSLSIPHNFGSKLPGFCTTHEQLHPRFLAGFANPGAQSSGLLLDRIGTPKRRAKRFCERKWKPAHNFRFTRFGEQNDAHEQNSKIPERQTPFAHPSPSKARKTRPAPLSPTAPSTTNDQPTADDKRLTNNAETAHDPALTAAG